jgi:hypothetical protein
MSPKKIKKGMTRKPARKPAPKKAPKAKPVKATAARSKPVKNKPAKAGGASASKAKVQAPAVPRKPLPSKFVLGHKIQRHKEVAWRMIDGEAVIITPTDSTMHSLNDVGTRIWELITGTRSLKDVAEVINSEFDVDLERAQKDTLWFVECLAKKGLIEAT